MLTVWDHRSSGRGLVQGLITEGDEAGRGTGAALGGEVRDGQTLSNRQDFSATAVQDHSRGVETLHLHYAVEKVLEALQRERKQGQGPRTVLARKLQDWLVVMK